MQRGLIGAAALVLAGVLATDDADACGGCFVQESENTIVSSHRMILSVSMSETTLWDQIVYDGDPSEFAWVLPTRGEVEVGLSSDALFAALDRATGVSIASPLIPCGGGAGSGSGDFNAAPAEDGDNNEGSQYEDPVEVIAQEVVGPFETVQLQSTDPDALNQWLLDHGYDIPADIQPIISAYVDEGFNFLALRLVPGQGVDAMRPVRISSSGAGFGLPLRMVAAGTGRITPISLFVMADGRYQPANMPSFVIKEEDLVWDWDTSSSNYSDLRQDKFDASAGTAWQIESAQPLNSEVGWQLEQISDQPETRGYGGGEADAEEEVMADLEKLIGHFEENEGWVTRLFAELSREALADDLLIEAAPQQEAMPIVLTAQRTIGTEPQCPPTVDDDGGICVDDTCLGQDGGLGPSACAFGKNPAGAIWLMSVSATLLIAVRRRRQTKS